MKVENAIACVYLLGSVYGLAWLVTRARLTGPVRKFLALVPFLGSLVRCIVCTGTWIGMSTLLLLPQVTWLGEDLCIRSWMDFLLMTGFLVCGLWILARTLGDAE